MSYNLSSHNDFSRPNVNSEHFGISSLRYLVVKVWNMIPNDMKNVNDIETFKNNIRKGSQQTVIASYVNIMFPV